MTRIVRISIAEWLPAIIGISWAIQQWLLERGLWLDEASLGLNLLKRDALGLFQPLDYGQAAPLLYLQLVKCMSLLFGPSVLSMRLLSLLAYIISVLVFMGLIRRTIQSPAARITGISLFCFNLMLLRYAGELKQYMAETMVAVVITYLAVVFYQEGGRRYHHLLIFGVAGILLSHTALNVLAMAGTMMLITWARNKDLQTLRQAFICGIAWLLAAGLYYMLVARHHPAHAFMQEYWTRAGGFGPDNPFSRASLDFLTNKLELLRNAKNIFHLKDRMLNLSLLFIPLACWIMNAWYKRRYLLLLAVPLILHMLLAYLRIYPFDIRLTLYLLPLTILAVSLGLDNILRFFRLDGKMTVWIFLALCIWQAIEFQSRFLPIRSEELGKVATELSKRILPGEKAWLNPDAMYAFRFYLSTEEFHFNDEQVIIGRAMQAEVPSFAEQISALQNDTWMMLTHISETDLRQMLKEVSARGLQVTDSIKEHQAFAYRLKRP